MMRYISLPLSIVGTAGILIALVYWGGTARPGPLFITGVAIFLLLILAFGVLLWWLYASPLLASTPITVTRRSLLIYRIVAYASTLSGVLFASGGVWDELWHRKFGGFGNDFLWPPHMLIYGSLALIALLAGGGLLVTMRGSGDVRERVRREPVIALLALLAAYLVASLPSDELWHRIYGLDITPWSLPHITIGSGFVLLMLATATLHHALMAAQPTRLHWSSVPVVIPIALAVVVWLQIATTEWEGVTAIGEVNRQTSAAFWARPEWLYPVLIISIAIFFETFALGLLRLPGAATVVPPIN